MNATWIYNLKVGSNYCIPQIVYNCVCFVIDVQFTIKVDIVTDSSAVHDSCLHFFLFYDLYQTTYYHSYFYRQRVMWELLCSGVEGCWSNHTHMKFINFLSQGDGCHVALPLRSLTFIANVQKSKYMTFALCCHLILPFYLTLKVHTSCNLILQRTQSISRRIIDQTLTSKPHIDSVVPRLRKIIYIFRTTLYVTNRETQKTIKYAFYTSILGYCIWSWGVTSKTHLIEISIERAQHAILQVGTDLPYLVTITSYGTFLPLNNHVHSPQTEDCVLKQHFLHI